METGAEIRFNGREIDGSARARSTGAYPRLRHSRARVSGGRGWRQGARRDLTDPLVWLGVMDAFERERGSLEVRLLRLPLGRDNEPQGDRGQLALACGATMVPGCLRASGTRTN